jgi:CCR4-NOT transcription complex subunit 1
LDNNTYNNKALLKNLGHWLGLITLAKNKPLPFDKGYLKSIIVEASGVEELMYTVPFVAKVLVSCAKSQVCLYIYFLDFLTVYYYILCNR